MTEPNQTDPAESAGYVPLSRVTSLMRRASFALRNVDCVIIEDGEANVGVYLNELFGDFLEEALNSGEIIYPENKTNDGDSETKTR